MIPSNIQLDHEFFEILQHEIESVGMRNMFKYFKCKNCNIIICKQYFDKDTIFHEMGKLQTVDPIHFEYSKIIKNNILNCKEYTIKSIIE